MFDLNRTITLANGALFDREATWKSYLPEAGDWKKTAVLLTGPLIAASAIVSYLLSLVFADSAMFAFLRPTLLSTLGLIISAAIAAGVVAFIFSALAGVFGGKNNFALGLAAVTLAFVPGYVGQALSWLPWIGGFLAIGLAIFSLVQLWKIIPIYLEVPDGKRAAHYIVSLIATIVVMLIIGKIVNPMIYGPGGGSPFDATSRIEPSSGGMLSEMTRRAAIVAQASEDTFAPPSDGKLTEKQVRSFVANKQKVFEANRESMQRMEELAESIEDDDEVSVKDLGAMMNGMKEVSGLGTSAIEIVKSDGGNWAEHQWVENTLYAASMQRGGNGSDTDAHNFELYEKYADQLANISR